MNFGWLNDWNATTKDGAGRRRYYPAVLTTALIILFLFFLVKYYRQIPTWIPTFVYQTDVSDWLSSNVIAAALNGIVLIWIHFSSKSRQEKLGKDLQVVKQQNTVQESKLNQVERSVTETKHEMNGKLLELLQAREHGAYLEGVHAGEVSERRHQEGLAALAAETASEVTVQIDGGRGIIVRCSDSVTRLLGWMKEEIIGRPLTMIIPERYREAHIKAMANYMSTGKKTMDWSSVKVHALNSSGAEVPVEISFSEMQAGPERRFIGIFRRRSEQSNKGKGG